MSHLGNYRYNVSVYPLDDADEWRYTACSRLVERGHTMFTQVFSAQPPLLFASLAESMRLFGDSIGGARAIVILAGLLCLVCTVALAWMLSGPVAAGASAILLSVSPLFLVYSRAVEAEVPMMACVTLSLAVALGYRRTRAEFLPVLAGLALAAAVLFKLFALETLAPALWILWLPEDKRRGARAVGAFLVASLLPVAGNFLLISPAEQWNQVVTMHQSAAGAALPNLLPPLRILADFASTDPGLTLLAVAGILTLALLGVWDDLVFLLLWVAGTAVMLLAFHPLFPHHATILLSGLAVCAGSAVTVLVEQLRSHRWSAASPLAAAAVLYLAFTPRLAHADRHVLVPGLPPADTQIARYMRSHTSANAVVASDNAAPVVLADRLVPPPLCDLSNVRFRSGFASTPLLVRATRDYRASLIAASPGGIFSQAPGYLEWVQRHYHKTGTVDGTAMFKLGP